MVNERQFFRPHRNEKGSYRLLGQPLSLKRYKGLTPEQVIELLTVDRKEVKLDGYTGLVVPARTKS